MQDHIDVYESGNEKLQGIMEKFKEELMHEVLAESISYEDAPEGAYSKDWNVNGEKVTLGVKKI